MIEARPRNTIHGPEFPAKGGEYQLALAPDQYFLRPRLAGWRAPRQGQTVRLAARSPAADADSVLEQVIAGAVAAPLGTTRPGPGACLRPRSSPRGGPRWPGSRVGSTPRFKKLDAVKNLARFVLLSNAYQTAAIGLDATRLAVEYADAGVEQPVVREPAKILDGIDDRLRATLPEDDPQLLTVRF